MKFLVFIFINHLDIILWIFVFVKSFIYFSPGFRFVDVLCFLSRRDSYFSFYQRVYDYFELEEANCEFAQLRSQLQTVNFSGRGFLRGKDSFSLLVVDHAGTYCAGDLILSEDFLVSDPYKFIFCFSSLKYKLRFLLSIKLSFFIF